MRKVKKEYFHHLLLKESATPQTYWKNVKLLMPSKCEKPSSLLLSNCLCSDPVTVANAYFVNIGPILNKGRNNSMDSSTDNGQKHLFIAPNRIVSPALGYPPCPQVSIEPVSHETVIEYL